MDTCVVVYLLLFPAVFLIKVVDYLEMVEALSSRPFPFVGMFDFDKDPISLIQSPRGNSRLAYQPTISLQ